MFASTSASSLTTLMLLPSLARAWSVAFYTGDNCNQDKTFNNAIYSGEGVSSCIAAGAPTYGCSWHENNGAVEGMCTAPMNPQPKSFMFAKAKCVVNWADNCEVPNWPTWKGLVAGKCIQVHDLPTKPAAQLTFKCWDD